MKKFVSVLIVAAAVLAVSCGGNANKNNEVVEEVEVVAVVDSTACCADSTCCADGAACDSTCTGECTK